MKLTRGTLRAMFERVGFAPNEAQWPVYEYMLACGGHFLGHTLEPGKVCYYALEDGDRLLQERLRLLGVSGNLDDLVFLDAIRPLNTPEGMIDLEGTITEEQPRLVIVDTLAAAKTGQLEENLAGDFADLANPLRTLAHNSGCCILLVHHHGKLAGGDAVLDLRGSTALGGAGDVIWGLYRDRGQPQAKLSATGGSLTSAISVVVSTPYTLPYSLRYR